uniref:Methyltransferase 21C, AARS1 lysine n=1 Tax=Myripristis murdjan TaxID=586833 RepID=A0A667YW31_9TELE
MDIISTSYLTEENNFVVNGKEEEEEGGKVEGQIKDENVDAAVQREQKPSWAPCFYYKIDREVYRYVGQEIIIQESVDTYGGMIWPGALALCHYLETHCEQLCLLDKAVLEIGAGTGLLSIVATLLGAWVTATDLPDVLSNLRLNLSKNTRGRCRHTPQVAALSWGYDLERTYPKSVYRYDYILAADVVYHHDFLDELLVTMKHFCQPGTTLIWANKIRFETDLTFTENFKKAFHTSLLAEDREGEIKIFMATCREGKKERDVTEELQDMLEKELREGEEEEQEKKIEEGESEGVKGEEEDRQEKSTEREEEERWSQSSGQIIDLKDEGYEEDEKDEREDADSRCSTADSDEDVTGESSSSSSV